MKTTMQTPERISHLIENGYTAIAKWILQASLLLTKYSYWFLFVFIFFSCQKNLTHTIEPTIPVSVQTEKPIEQFIIIDTAKYPFASHTSSLSTFEPLIQERIQHKIKHFYGANSLKTKWMGIEGPTPLYYTLLANLKNATHHGLNVEAYNLDLIAQRVTNVYKNKLATAKDIIDVDIAITETFFLFATHLREGRITDAGYRDKTWILHHRAQNDVDVMLLASAKKAADFNNIIKSLQPSHEQYVKLKNALALYRSLEKMDVGPLPISTRENIKPSSKHIAIPMIRKKLSLMEIQIITSEKIDVASSDSMYYDNTLVSAVKIFQQQHGLAQDGIIRGKTLTFLNQSFKEKADLIALNMERLRWLPEHLAAQYIRVNIPEYKLRIYEQEKRTLELNVIVGSVSTATPVFSDTLEYVVLSPTWTVPPSLVKNEFLPRLKKDKTYYTNRKNFVFYKNGVEIDPSAERWDSVVNVHQYRIVQKSGSDNALGLAKFIMPNDMNIYLHDTPDHKPFSDRYRALSHGCIRIDDPAKLAAYLLGEQLEWNLENIKKAMVSTKPTKIVLTKQYQVHLEYRTVWVDDIGNVNFGEDIYGHDKRHLQRLSRFSTNGSLVTLN